MGKLFASGWGLLAVLLASTCCSAQVQPSHPDTLATHYREPRLGLQLRVPASFEAEASPTGPPPPELTARLRQLLGRNPAKASVLVYFRQATAPHSALAVVQLPEAQVSWAGLGLPGVATGPLLPGQYAAAVYPGAGLRAAHRRLAVPAGRGAPRGVRP